MGKLTVPRQVTGPVDHRDQVSDGDADQAGFQDEGDCGHEVKDGFDNRTRPGHQEVPEHEALLRDGKNSHNLLLEQTLNSFFQKKLTQLTNQWKIM